MKTIQQSLVLNKMLLLCLISLALFSCSTIQSTGYQAANEADGEGYRHVKLTDNQYRVVFSGNRHTTMETAKDYALLHAADLTLEQGYDWFVVAESDSAIETKPQTVVGPTDVNQTPTAASCGLLGCAISQPAINTVSASYEQDVKDKVVASLLITMGKGQPQDKTSSFDARTLRETLHKAG